MLILFDSKTGNVKRFVAKLNMQCIQISESLMVNEPYVLVTYTTGFGEVPRLTKYFLSRNHEFLKAVAVSGNRNWGKNFGISGDAIALNYGVPLLLKFELSGTNKDVSKFREDVQTLCQNGLS